MVLLPLPLPLSFQCMQSKKKRNHLPFDNREFNIIFSSESIIHTHIHTLIQLLSDFLWKMFRSDSDYDSSYIFWAPLYNSFFFHLLWFHNCVDYAAQVHTCHQCCSLISHIAPYIRHHITSIWICSSFRFLFFILRLRILRCENTQYCETYYFHRMTITQNQFNVHAQILSDQFPTLS